MRGSKTPGPQNPFVTLATFAALAKRAKPNAMKMEAAEERSRITDDARETSTREGNLVRKRFTSMRAERG